MRFPLRLLVITVAMLGGAALVGSPATADTSIRPGDRISSSVGGCTLNFVYDGVAGKARGKTYFGTAAHCVAKVGEVVRLGNRTGEVLGRVAVLGKADTVDRDYALIEVDSGLRSRVAPGVRGNTAYPTGVTTASETTFGDQIQISGHGVGFGATATTRQRRVGTLTYDDANEHEVLGTLTFGDSGGPLVHVRTGKAWGIVSQLCIGVCEEMGPTVEGILTKLRAKGFDVRVRPV